MNKDYDTNNDNYIPKHANDDNNQYNNWNNNMNNISGLLIWTVWESRFGENADLLFWL